MKEKLLKIARSLGLAEKFSAKTMTAEDWVAFNKAYEKAYGNSVADDIAADDAAKKAANTNRQIMSIIDGDDAGATADTTTTETEASTEGGAPETIVDETTGTDNGDSEDEAPTDEATIAAVLNIVNENKTMKKTIATLGGHAAPDVPSGTASLELSVNGPGNSATHLFGIPSDFFDIKKRWNKIALNPAHATLEDCSEEDAVAFRSSIVNFGRSLAKRYAVLKQNNMLDPKKLEAGFGLTTTGLGDAKLGDQYMVRRQDALIARILSVRTVTDLFPVRYGVQDRELLTNAFFTEVSQGWQPGEIWKGDMTLEPEFGHVDDAMVKILFGPMKEIEKKYIGYLNTDGSDPIKWSMIEFALLGIYTQMQNEQNKRRIVGIYTKPEIGVAGSYLNASTGLFYTLVRYMHENKLLPHADATYANYGDSDMLASVQDYCADVLASVSEEVDLSQYAIYLNYSHRAWWKKNIRAAYGKETDFVGPDSYMNVVPDTDIPIKWVPNLGQLKLMFMQIPGNIQFMEFLPGEMFGVKIKEDMELVKAWSTWKEGTGAAFVGRNFADAAALAANNYALQQIFMNKPLTALAADATTADAAVNIWFQSVANTGATALTDITGAKKGVAYIFECGSVTNATTIAKAGRFDSITVAYNPTKVGDYIMVILNSANKFVELERCVNGTRTVNATLQPTVPGAR